MNRNPGDGGAILRLTNPYSDNRIEIIKLSELTHQQSRSILSTCQEPKTIHSQWATLLDRARIKLTSIKPPSGGQFKYQAKTFITGLKSALQWSPNILFKFPDNIQDLWLQISAINSDIKEVFQTQIGTQERAWKGMVKESSIYNLKSLESLKKVIPLFEIVHIYFDSPNEESIPLGIFSFESTFIQLNVFLAPGIIQKIPSREKKRQMEQEDQDLLSDQDFLTDTTSSSSSSSTSSPIELPAPQSLSQMIKTIYQ
jgi:hypothetical protein